ncbi:hypothetical protein BRYFOR_07488 [Marvinbryantia formatexigens DSM 14469]|uniref:Uncharacterized protein n=1 Tax=Marvinbryantia formatexigens DSM 14469 TaxID=478749 RepID=C6LFS8_9FIRM|nr:hypothetical protein BRYFOR_07488 [Marvinbryantia formatexigens DSM 14469]
MQNSAYPDCFLSFCHVSGRYAVRKHYIIGYACLPYPKYFFIRF